MLAPAPLPSRVGASIPAANQYGCCTNINSVLLQAESIVAVMRHGHQAFSISNKSDIKAVRHHQMMARMHEALAMVSQVSTALSASIREAATWLGHHHAHTTNPARIQQVHGLTKLESPEAIPA